MIKQTRMSAAGKKTKLGKSVITDADDVKTKSAAAKKKTAKSEKTTENISETASNEGGI